MSRKWKHWPWIFWNNNNVDISNLDTDGVHDHSGLIQKLAFPFKNKFDINRLQYKYRGQSRNQ